MRPTTPLAFIVAAGLLSTPALVLAQQPTPEEVDAELEAKRKFMEEQEQQAAEKLKAQAAAAAQELEEAKKKAALGQGPIGVPGVPPPLRFEEAVKDIGRVMDDAPVNVKFTFTNVADRPVRVTNVSGSCGCTVPQKLAKDTYAPGESGEVVATYNPAGRRGREVKHVYVDTDFSQSPRVEATFSVETLPRIAIDPMNVFMGEIRRGETRSQTVSITGREADFDVTEARFSDNTTSFSLKRMGKTEVVDTDGTKLTRVQYQVDLAPGLALGSYRSGITLATTDPKRPNVSLQVQAAVVGDLRLAPDRVFVVANQGGQPWVRDLRIDHRRGESFWINSIETVDVAKDLKMVIDLIPNQPGAGNSTGYALKISGTTPGVSGVLTGKIILHTSVADQAVIEIPLQGNIQILTPAQ